MKERLSITALCLPSILANAQNPAASFVGIHPLNPAIGLAESQK